MSSKEIKIIEARINEELDNIDSLTSELSDKNLYGEVAGISEDTFFFEVLPLFCMIFTWRSRTLLCVLKNYF